MSSGKNDPQNPPEGIHDDKENNTVLIYDFEAGETTQRFVDALKHYLTEFKLNDFHDADDEKKGTLPIIAVVRCTSIRIDECLRQMSERLHQDDVEDMKRVIIIYICMNASEKEEISNWTRVRSYSEAFSFANIVQLDFIDYKLEPSGYINKCLSFFSNDLISLRKKEHNEIVLMELKKCLKGKAIRTKLSVKVYFAMDEQLVKLFVAELHQYVKSSIHIQDAQPIEELKKVTSVTLFLTTGQEKLNIKDLKKVILIKINTSAGSNMPDDENSCTITEQKSDNSMTLSENAEKHAENESCQEYGKIWKVTYVDGEFESVLNFLDEFKKFVRTCCI